MERVITPKEAAIQVIIAPVPELIYPVDWPERHSAWHRLGDILIALEVENPALMQQAGSE